MVEMERASHGVKKAFSMSTQAEAISAKGDPLETIKTIVEWEDFRADDRCGTGNEADEGKSNSGRKPYDTILKFKIVCCSRFTIF